MICNNIYLADILGVCEVKDIIWVMRFQSPLVYIDVQSHILCSFRLFAVIFSLSRCPAKGTSWHVCSSKSRIGLHATRIQMGTGGPDPLLPPLKNYKAIELLSNTDPDPLENHKATKPAFNVGPSSAHQRNAI